MKKPELLAPAGSPEALVAAISAGADAIYMGLPKFNARVNADNFQREDLERAVKLCRLYGKKLYITLNTLIFDRELADVLEEAKFCAEAGVDAFIVQDLGLMRLLRETLPEVPVHASTQCATHNLEQIRTLASLGVTRVVVARELSRGDLCEIMNNTPVEIEVFVHGALCMSHSGTCLMSAYMGGRSGNRGECAQPCRLPYNNAYPLSLRDLSLARHVKELCELGIDSFKIEGRMKSPEYVYRTVTVWRRLIDEGRDATDEEMRELENIFSRNGFTDGYYTLKKGKEMFGTRSGEDKEKTRETERITSFELPKIPINIKFSKNNEKAELVISSNGKTVSCECEALPAEGDGTGEDVIRDALLKLGGTEFVCENIEIIIDSPAFFKRSSLNALRREAVEKLEKSLIGDVRAIPNRKFSSVEKKTFKNDGLWIVFCGQRKVDKREVEGLISQGASRVFLPFSTEIECFDKRCGIVLPRAVFDKDRDDFEKRLESSKALGYEFALVDNLGVGMIASRHGFSLYGGSGLNAVNSYTLSELQKLGFQAVLVSGEVTEAQKRGFSTPIPVGDTVWGRAPLMLIENCVMGVRDGCFGCTEICRKKGALTDRTGETFPVIPDMYHRSVIYNSRITYNADKKSSDTVSFRAIYITDENPIETLEKVLEGNTPDFKFTRK